MSELIMMGLGLIARIVEAVSNSQASAKEAADKLHGLLIEEADKFKRFAIDDAKIDDMMKGDDTKP